MKRYRARGCLVSKRESNFSLYEILRMWQSQKLFRMQFLASHNMVHSRRQFVIMKDRGQAELVFYKARRAEYHGHAHGYLVLVKKPCP